MKRLAEWPLLNHTQSFRAIIDNGRNLTGKMMIKEQLFSNWYPLRWFMLIAGLFFGYNYLTIGSAISGLLSLIILFQALTNTGCLLGYCSNRFQDQVKPESAPEDVTFEEIKIN